MGGVAPIRSFGSPEWAKVSVGEQGVGMAIESGCGEQRWVL